MEPLKGIIVFSAVETATVIGWFALLSAGHPVLGAVALFVGYLLEHVIAFNVGKDRAYLSRPRR